MKRNNISKKRLCLIAASAMILVVAAVGGTLAYLKAQTPDVVNTFTPSKIETNIEETFDGTTKTNVKVTNTGDIDAYIRAKIVINWVKEETNEVLPASPKDYVMVMGSPKWKQIGDIYYYTEKVPAGTSTANLIDKCTVNAKKDGYVLNVTILAEGVQAEPDRAIKELWGIDPVTWEKVKAGVK